MAASDTGRKLLFALALGLLVAWAAVLGFQGSGGRGSSPDRSAQWQAHHGARSPGRTPEDNRRSAVAQSAMAFTDAYLGYEVGDLSGSDRRTLARLSTSHFAAQLLADRPRRPATGVPSREWAARVEAVHVGIFGGAPALLVGVLVVGVNGAHVLTPTFVERGSRWLVAGIGA